MFNMNRPKEKLFAYLAGPYSGDHKKTTVKGNIKRAMRAARYLKTMGYVVFCPHLNFMYLEGIDNTPHGREEILEMCLMWLEKCDVVFFMPKWKDSPGCAEEHRKSKVMGIRRKYLTKQELLTYNNTI